MAKSFDRLTGGTLDPYYRIAAATGFADHGGSGDGNHPIRIRIDASADQACSFDQALAAVPGLVLSSADVAAQFRTGTVPKGSFVALSNLKGFRVTLAEPVVAQRLRLLAPRERPPQLTQEPMVATPDNDTLLGIIDTGCPFANQALCDITGAPRVRWLWDQGSGAHWAGHGFGLAGHDGIVLTGADLAALMRLCSSYEPDVYRYAGYSAMFGRRSHGAFSLGLLASNDLWLGAGVGHQPRVRMQDPAAQAAIAFVQLPHDVLQAVSVSALEARAYEGICFIVRRAETGGYKRAIVSFGYESWTGPHDGSDWFCRAVDEAISRSPITLQVHIAGGNSRSRRAHVAGDSFWSARAQGLLSALMQTGNLPRLSKEWVLNVPPGCEVPTFIELWSDVGQKPLNVKVVAPHAPAIDFQLKDKGPQVFRGSSTVACVSTGPMAVVRIAPTATFDGRATAAAGRWKLVVDGTFPALRTFHAYVGRTEETLGAERRGRQAFFSELIPQEAAADENGTLNNHAMGSKIVAAGSFRRESYPYRPHPVYTSYSLPDNYGSKGPGRTRNSRASVDIELAVDDGLYAIGCLGMGNYSGCIVRMQGTSAAAPLSARLASQVAASQSIQKRKYPARIGGRGAISPSRSPSRAAPKPQRTAVTSKHDFFSSFLSATRSPVATYPKSARASVAPQSAVPSGRTHRKPK